MSSLPARLWRAAAVAATMSACVVPAASAAANGAQPSALPRSVRPPAALMAPPSRPHRHGALRARAAHATVGVPSHQLSAQKCTWGQVSVTVPAQAYPWYAGTREYVYYRADVYRWTGSGWTFATGTPWARAIAGPQGLETVASGFAANLYWSWYDGSRYSDYLNQTWTFNLQPGSYEVLQQIIWGSHMDSPHAEVPKFTNGSQYCTF